MHALMSNIGKIGTGRAFDDQKGNTMLEIVINIKVRTA
jgi:hypothetical protein